MPTDALDRLMTWTPEDVDLRAISELNNGPGVFEPGDEKVPFFSEAYLYNLLGKEDARTLMTLVHQALEEFGVNRETQRRRWGF